jgi:hypothetical protein
MSLEREVGILTGSITAVEKDLREVKSDVKLLLAAEARRQGAWKVTLGAGAFAGAAVAFIANMIELVWGKG